jgi:hypothetical protein
LQPVRTIALKTLPSALNGIGKDQFHFMDSVNDKRDKYKRTNEKAAAVHEQRTQLGFPCNSKIKNLTIKQPSRRLPMEQYLTTDELSERIKMPPGSIRNLVWKNELKLNVHYVKTHPPENPVCLECD